MTGSAWARRATPEIIRAGTQLRSVPLVPDIRLHQAGDPISLWQETELTSGRTGLDPPFWAFAWAGGLALGREAVCVHSYHHAPSLPGQRIGQLPHAP